MRNDFSFSTKEILARRVAYRCSNPECRKPTSGPQSDPSKAVNLGVAAHITAASAGGPRFDATLVESQRVSGENGLWLCQTCAKLVDNDPPRYTVDILLAWKREAERRAVRDLETSPPGVALTLSSFAVDTSTCAYAEHRWDPAKPLWPKGVDAVGVVYERGRLKRYGRTFESHEEANQYGAELEARYNHYSFSSSSRHRLYCEPLRGPAATGVNHPIFYAGVSNHGPAHVVLVRLTVIVHEVTPLTAVGYSHTLASEHTYEVGVGPAPGSYHVSMIPGLKIEAGDAAAFRIAVRPKAERVGGYAWLFSMSIESSSGDSLPSPLVAITM